MATTPNRPEHANKTIPVPGADPRFTITRYLAGYAYPANGNLHNPTPRYRWLLNVDGRIVDQATTKRDVVRAARENGAAYLAEIDRAPSA
jgi:hypothetical protein